MHILSSVDTIVPLGNKVMQRAPDDHTGKLHSRLAERNAAVHAPRALFTSGLYG